jgi:hypothetical protein
MSAAALASSAPSASSSGGATFPSGSWTLYFHDPEDTDWSPSSYKKLGVFSDFAGFWGTLYRIGADKFLSGMFFLMRGAAVPLWEHRSNISGGSYCIKVPEAAAAEAFQRYAAAAILEVAALDATNTIVGVTISPKKGFHILKVWNASCARFNRPHEIRLLGDSMRLTDVLYRPHVEQRF